MVYKKCELAIGATRAIPVGGRYAFRDMGMLSWSCVVASHHPLALMDGPFITAKFSKGNPELSERIFL